MAELTINDLLHLSRRFYVIVSISSCITTLCATIVSFNA